MKLKQGNVKLSWKKHGGEHCDSAAKGGIVHLDCGEHGGVISKILFASYGFPQGTDCASMKIDPKCHDSKTEDTILKHCLGKEKCDMKALSNGLSCENVDGKVERLVVKVKCSVEDAKLHVKTHLPLGTSARLYHTKKSRKTNLGNDIHFLKTH